MGLGKEVEGQEATWYAGNNLGVYCGTFTCFSYNKSINIVELYAQGHQNYRDGRWGNPIIVCFFFAFFFCKAIFLAFFSFV